MTNSKSLQSWLKVDKQWIWKNKFTMLLNIDELGTLSVSKGHKTMDIFHMHQINEKTPPKSVPLIIKWQYHTEVPFAFIMKKNLSLEKFYTR